LGLGLLSVALRSLSLAPPWLSLSLGLLILEHQQSQHHQHHQQPPLRRLDEFPTNELFLVENSLSCGGGCCWCWWCPSTTLPVLCLIAWRFTNENFLCNSFCADKAVTKTEGEVVVGVFLMACRRHPGGSPVHLDHPEEAWPPRVSPLLAHESADM
jgi:hypothetical protein